MAAAIEKAGVIFQTGYFMRSNPVMRFLKEAVDKGVFGQISRVRASNCHAGATKGWFDTEWRWMAAPAIAGCGAFGDLGTHSLDLLLWMFGPVRAVSAVIHPVIERYPGCDETGETLLEFASGTEGHAALVNGNLLLQTANLPGADGSTPWTDLPEAAPHAFELFLDALEGTPPPRSSPRAKPRNAAS